MFMYRLVSMTAIENFHQPRRGVKNSEAVCIIPVTHASLTLWAASTPALVAPQLHRITRVSPQTERSEERRVGKECRSLCDWSSDVCSSDSVLYQSPMLHSLSGRPRRRLWLRRNSTG